MQVQSLSPAEWVKDLALPQLHNFGSDLIPGPGSSISRGMAKKAKAKKKKKKKKKTKQGVLWWLIGSVS